MELDPAEKPGFTRRLVKRTSSMLDGAYTAKMEKVYSQGCDPVTGAPNLDFEPIQKDAGHSGVFLPSSGLTGTEHNPLPAHHMPTY